MPWMQRVYRIDKESDPVIMPKPQKAPNTWLKKIGLRICSWLTVCGLLWLIADQIALNIAEKVELKEMEKYWYDENWDHNGKAVRLAMDSVVTTLPPEHQYQYLLMEKRFLEYIIQDDTWLWTGGELVGEAFQWNFWNVHEWIRRFYLDRVYDQWGREDIEKLTSMLAYIWTRLDPEVRDEIDRKIQRYEVDEEGRYTWIGEGGEKTDCPEWYSKPLYWIEKHADR